MTSDAVTAGLFNFQIAAASGVTSVYDGMARKFTISSAVAGTLITVGNLTIVRSPIAPNTTVNNVVAIAEQANVTIPQLLFAGDTIAFTVAGTGLTQAFTGDTDTTLILLADQITTLTSVSGSYNSVNHTIDMIAKVAGNAFSMSNFVVTSSGIPTATITPNIAPVAQVNTIDIPRTLYSDESLAVTVSGSTVVQSYDTSYVQTLTELTAQLDALSDVDVTLSGSQIAVTSATPGVPYAIGNLTISGGTIQGVNLVPNRMAVAQKDAITIPRDLVPGDTIHFAVNGTPITQAYTGSSDATIAALSVAINSQPNVTSSVNFGLRTITIDSTVAGTSFSLGGLTITTSVVNQNVTANVTPQAQSASIDFGRSFQAGDMISVVVNGNTITESFSGDTDATLTALASEIDGMINIGATPDTLNKKIIITADTAGTGFNVSDTNIINNIAPTVLVASVTPVKQVNTFTLPNTLLSGDTIDLTVDGSVLSGAFDSDEVTTMSGLQSQLDALATVDSSLDAGSKTFSVISATAGTPFAMSQIVTTSAPFTGSTLTGNTAEIKASLTLDVVTVPAPSDTIIIGSCLVTFGSGAGFDTDCSDNDATIDVVSIASSDVVAALLRGLSGVNDVANGLLAMSGSGTQAIFMTAGTQTSTSDIDSFNDTSGSIVMTPASPVLAVAETDVLTLPRAFVPGDSFTVVVNGITVTQNFTSDHTTTLSNLNTQLNTLPNISSVVSGNDLILSAVTAGTPFTLGNAQYVNTQISTVSVSNTVGTAQKDVINFPSAFVAGDTVHITINGTPVTVPFSTDSNATFLALSGAIGAAVPAVMASLSGGLALVLEAVTAGNTFSIDHLDVTNITTPTPVTTNIPGVAQVDTLTIPFAPAVGDSIAVQINGTTLTQPFATDASGTLSLLNTQIDGLATVNSSVNVGSGIFTITSAMPGVAFSGGLLSTGATITSQTLTGNTTADAQVDTLTVNRVIASSDTLTLAIDGNTLTQGFSGDTSTTLSLLNTQIDALASVDAVFNGTDTFTITASASGTAFIPGVLTINNTTPSVNVTSNVPAQTQVDRVTLPRSLIAGDTVSLNLNGTVFTQAFTGGTDVATLGALQAQIASSTGATLGYVGNVLTFTAETSGVAFVLSGFTVQNSVLPAITVANTAPVKQQTQFILPTFVAGDAIDFTLNSTSVTGAFLIDQTGTVNALMTTISLLNMVDPSYSGGILNMTSQVAGSAFALSSATITNTTAPIIVTANVPAQAQVIDLTPGGPVIEGLTYRATINGQDYDYLTLSGNTSIEIISGLASLMATNTGVIVSTGATLRVTAATPGVAFTYATTVLDITAPIASTPISTPETLKSGSTSTSTIQSNEDGDIYLILSGALANTTSDITTAIVGNQAFVGKLNALKNTPYTVSVAAGVPDGLYNIVAVDAYSNVSQAVPGWLTVDNTAPVVTIVTPAHTVNTASITITGSTEANLQMDVTGGSSALTGTALAGGTFSFDVPLNQDLSNTLVFTATDAAGNVGTGTVTIIQDSLMPSLTIATQSGSVNTPTITITGSTDPNITAELLDATGSVIATGVSDGSGSFSLTGTLMLDQSNTLTVRVTDAGTNTNSGTVTIIQDSISPNIILDPLPAATAASSVQISGTTEANASLVLINGTGTLNTVATSTGYFTATVMLSINATNTINLTATDAAGNSGTGSTNIIQDSVPNALLITTLNNQHINAASLTVTGSTKPNAAVSISGGSGSSMTGSADGAGVFSLDISLTRNAPNTLVVSSTDQVNVTVTGSILVTEDSINPTVGIATPVQTTYNQNFTVTGTTEPNAFVAITGGTGALSDGSGNYSIITTLISDSLNTLLVTVTDQAGNIGTGSVDITHDSTVISLSLAVSDQSVNTPTFSFTGQTKSGATVAITGGSGIVNLVAPAGGVFTGTVTLNQNQANTILVTATDATLTSATGGFVITHDSIAPVFAFVGAPTVVTVSPVTLTGLTDPNISVTITNGTGVYNATADGSGIVSFSIPLIQNTINAITVTPTDLALNTGSGVSVNITHDSLGPVISSLGVTPFATGATMTANYSFTTDETANATFTVGTGANVLATEIASGSTVGLNHAGAIPGLLANQTYYYFIQATDTLGNVTASTIGAINSIDTTGPVLSNTALAPITATSTSLDFSYSDAHATVAFATGGVHITDGVNVYDFPLNLSFGNMTNTGSSDFTGLSGGTAYTYSLLLKDDFGNGSVQTGSFVTATPIVLSGGNITQTGAVVLNTGAAVGNTLSLNSTTLAIISNPALSGLATGSLSSSGVTSITWIGAWDGVILPPSLVDSSTPEAAIVSEISALVSALNTASFTYVGSVIATIQAGSDTASLIANGGGFVLQASLGSTSYSGQTLHIYRSADGVSWQVNTPGTTCVVAPNNTCALTTDHLSYFAFASVTGTPVATTPPVVSSNSGGGGGGGLSMDHCPAGDYSPSYYDGKCGSKPTTSTTGSVSNPQSTPTSQNTKPTSPQIILPADNAKLNNSIVNQVDAKIRTIPNIASIDAASFAKEITDRVYTRTIEIPARITIFTSLVRYTQAQAERASNAAMKTFFQVLRDSFTSTIDTLRHEASLGIATIPNKKKNNTSTEMVAIKTLAGAAKSYRYVNTETVLAVRSTPNLASDTVGYAFADQRVELLAIGPNWSQVSFDKTAGFVRTRLLRKTQSTSNNSPLTVYNAVSGGERMTMREDETGID